MVLDSLVLLVAVVIAIPLWVIALQSALALTLSNIGTCEQESGSQPTYAIVIPAHNEAGILHVSLSKLLAELDDPAVVVVVADNCTDATADIARALGVKVLERHDLTRRGKGYALAHGIEYLREWTAPPEIVVFLDADCDINRLSMQRLLASVSLHNKPAQAIYLMRMGDKPSIKRRVAGFAWLVKNKIRPLAMNRLGLPVTLTGTGMAFPWRIFDVVQLAHGNIVEDMQLGIDCAILGMPPVLCTDAEVFSDFPEQQAAEQSQRTRWEHGHLQTIVQQIPRLLAKTLQNRDWRLLGLALDIGVPPLSLLVLMAIVGVVFSALLLPFTGFPIGFYGLLVSFACFALMMVLLWRRFGLDYLSAKDLLAIPLYVVSKFSIYKAFIVKREKNWVRTDRDV
ncbi:glycosyltransferase family 2 protein [Methylosoma difficile]